MSGPATPGAAEVFNLGRIAVRVTRVVDGDVTEHAVAFASERSSLEVAPVFDRDGLEELEAAVSLMQSLITLIETGCGYRQLLSTLLSVGPEVLS